MNLQFEDSNLALVYLQTKLKENYNNLILVNSKYYKQFNINYGFAHYIFKYLNLMYPPMDTSLYNENLPNSAFDNTLTTIDCTSIANYFVCSNNNTKLILPEITDGFISTNTEHNRELMKLYPEGFNTYLDIYSTQISSIMRKNDSPIFINADYSINPNDRIYYLYKWKTNKQICEIDDLVMSYLLGRVIGPNSTMEEIYYVQKLVIGENYIQLTDKGIWDSNSGNLTDLLIEYQRSKVNVNKPHTPIVTGYFDIYTEASLLKDRGEQLYGIYGL